ncbi:DNA primase, large subunit [Suhomyces tanzawaensis NRRL Y-17324]|uniref:DNA primase large subunit n=1 Tax=Suhomyces tanzawaensis NRRL Y-17324 TaxID=984487 RepID=A0A1E4SFD0_9ASCO|nr:DNA primase, large subunit [Suhomyces tanzawaensis NRRL Y-17324]ODV78218.1 DNA primase, large subunit [Suhomyces tanzawaensis NRRL Y-17324]
MFRQPKRRTAGRKNFDLPQIYHEQSYKSRLSMYDQPPLLEVTLEEFELWAIDRLKVLIEIESCVARTKTIKQTEAAIKPLLLKYLPLSPATASNQAIVDAERKKDYYSHFILRLVFCRNEELRKKFVKNESILFRIRYAQLQPKEQQEFVDSLNDKLSWTYISSEEKRAIVDKLYAATGAAIRTVLMADSPDTATMTNEQIKQRIATHENFIKLPFEKVPNLTSSRSVFIQAGYAYIPTTMQLSLLAVDFQENLSQMLIRTFQSLPRLEEDDRLLPLLNNLSQNFSSYQYDAAQYGEAKSDINAISITKPAITRHYPLCASHVQKNLVANSHLKYDARSQLSLFLKGIGLSVDEALKFWADQFTKGASGITMDTFNKNYRYNIRHDYGLEGGRINKRPWDCARILQMTTPRSSSGQYHGCPYKTFSADVLTHNLQELGITDQHEINGVIDQVANNEYTHACTRVFELTHKNELKGTKAEEEMHISHPNLYFDRSRQLERAATEKS